ncbi:MAG: hypothetical protein KA715_03655 [Xanthomonadaceae bacterium]|nr:hypothetical protein [Xanthomonadaceae bacterium]
MANQTLAKERKIQTPYLQIFVIDPPKPLDWSSPKSLLRTTLWNGLSLDYAPNGHLAVHVKTRRPNAYGVSEVLTGMGRTNKMKTLWDTFYHEYGLSAMIREFSGDLDSSITTKEEIKKAADANRLAIIQVQLTDEKADLLMEFMSNWIEFGSFRHYGGNKNVPKGEGSGCADFAVYFIELAMKGHLPSDQWMRTVHLPYELLQEAPGRKSKKVSISSILKSTIPWAKSAKEGLKFSIPDPEKMTKWIMTYSAPFTKRVTIFPDEFQPQETLDDSMIRFQTPYSRESEQTIIAHWKKIKL